MAERSSWLRPEKSSYVDSGLAEDRSERSLSHIACVMRDGDFSSTLRVAPDLLCYQVPGDQTGSQTSASVEQPRDRETPLSVPFKTGRQAHGILDLDDACCGIRAGEDPHALGVRLRIDV